MENHEGKGGSYIRQADGSLKLTQRTEHPETVFAVPEEKSEPEAEPASEAPSGRKGTK